MNTVLFLIGLVAIAIAFELVIQNAMNEARQNFARVALVFVLAMFGMSYMPASAQTAKLELIKTIGSDTVNVSGLNVNGNEVEVVVCTDDNQANTRIIETIEFLNCSNKNVQKRLIKVGYFDIKQNGGKQFVSLSDNSEHIIMINDENLEVKRTYKVIVPVNKAVINKKPQ